MCEKAFLSIVVSYHPFPTNRANEEFAAIGTSIAFYNNKRSGIIAPVGTSTSTKKEPLGMFWGIV